MIKALLIAFIGGVVVGWFANEGRWQMTKIEPIRKALSTFYSATQDKTHFMVRLMERAMKRKDAAEVDFLPLATLVVETEKAAYASFLIRTSRIAFSWLPSTIEAIKERWGL